MTERRKAMKTIRRPSNRGAEAAGLVSAEAECRPDERSLPTLKELLLSDEARFDFDLPKRGRLHWRRPGPLR
jgi:antitoxin Phd